MNDAYYPKHSREESRTHLLEVAWATEVSKVAHLRLVIKEMLAALMLPDAEMRAKAMELGEQALRSTEKP